MGVTYSTNLNKFAEQIVWFMPPEQALRDMNYFLVHLMAKSSEEAYCHFRATFPQFSDDDFKEALRNARPGIFMYEEEWLRWNKRFGLEPPLPFPIKYPKAASF